MTSVCPQTSKIITNHASQRCKTILLYQSLILISLSEQQFIRTEKLKRISKT